MLVNSAHDGYPEDPGPKRHTLGENLQLFGPAAEEPSCRDRDDGGTSKYEGGIHVCGYVYCCRYGGCFLVVVVMVGGTTSPEEGVSTSSAL